MSWDPKYPNFGVLKIENTKLKVHYDQYHFVTISVNEQIQSASWAGGEINVTLASGKVRRYSDQYHFKTI